MSGNRQSLFFGVSNGTSNTVRYLLPPLPPVGTFDVRFSSQRIAEFVGKGERKEVSIIISSAAFPVKIQWKESSENAGSRLLIDGASLRIHDTGEIVLSNRSSLVKLQLASSTQGDMPKSFALLQNYPNPFNPLTVIGYQISAPRLVSLKVYDILGQLVATLVDETQQPGTYRAEWDAGKSPSGVYYYRLRAGQFTDVKKMVLLR